MQTKDTYEQQLEQHHQIRRGIISCERVDGHRHIFMMRRGTEVWYTFSDECSFLTTGKYPTVEEAVKAFHEYADRL